MTGRRGDALTNNLRSKLGLVPGMGRRLPPVNNLRIINLQKNLTAAEDDLHRARVALYTLREALENPTTNAANIEALSDDLFERMRRLESREQDYFANTYITKKNPTILHGWANKGKQDQFTDKIEELRDQAQTIAIGLRPQGILSDAFAAATTVRNAYESLRRMDNQWYNYDQNQDRVFPRRATPSDPIQLAQRLERIKTLVQNVENFAVSNRREDYVKSIESSRDRAKTCLRLAHQVQNNNWELPLNLR